MKWSNVKPYFVSILLAVGVGALASFLTKDSMAAYEAVAKSPLTPPSTVFPIVWTVLFVLMGISAAMVWTAPKSTERTSALRLYAIQLAVNFCWSFLFFSFQAYLLSFLWLVLLWVLILAMIAAFYQIRPAAAYLQIPYLLWVTFAGYLNFIIWVLNR